MDSNVLWTEFDVCASIPLNLLDACIKFYMRTPDPICRRSTMTGRSERRLSTAELTGGQIFDGKRGRLARWPHKDYYVHGCLIDTSVPRRAKGMPCARKSSPK